VPPLPIFEPPIAPKPKVDSVSEFPLLEGAVGGSPLPTSTGPMGSIAQKVALTSGKNVSSSSSSSSKPPKWNAKVTGSSRHDEEFPALGLSDQPSSNNNNSKPSSRPFAQTAAYVPIMHNPNPVLNLPKGPRGMMTSNGIRSMEEFPSLGNPSGGKGSGGGGGSSAWKGSGVKMKGQMPRSLKVAPAPLERKIEVERGDEFHFVPLSVSRARKDSITKKYDPEEEYMAPVPAQEESKSNNNNNKGSGKKKEGPANKIAAAADALFNGKGKGSSGAKIPSQNGPSSSGDRDNSIISKSKSPPKSPQKQQQQKASKSYEDFPSLGSPKKNPNVAGIAAATTMGPPPGFSTAASKPRLDEFDMSFLRDKAADEELAAAKQGSSGKLWLQPQEFVRRSEGLLDGARSSLSADDDGSSFELWRSVSGQFRRGEMEAKEYYELCRDMFGMTDWKVIFPELVALTADIGKQQVGSSLDTE
jgi:hypothetical protein